jgi:hypothetical protein
LSAIGRVATIAFAALWVAWVGWSLYVVIRDNAHVAAPFHLDATCQNTSFSCGVLSGTLGLFLSLALGYALVLWRLSRVQIPYVRKARE